MPKPRRQFIDTGYGQTHVRISAPEAPTKTPIICLHMSPMSGRVFEKFMTAASDDRIVIAPDYPGCGESDRPSGEPELRIQDYARTMWEVLDQLEINTVNLFGHHTGSKVAAAMVNQRPHAIESIVMVSALALTKQERSQSSYSFDPISLDDEGTRFRNAWKALLRLRGPGMTLEMVATAFAENLRCGQAYNWGLRAASAYNEFFPDVLRSIKHKVTVINPKDDLFELTPRIMDLLPNATLINKPEWGHGFLDVFSEDAAKVITNALD